ncbi:hypothetical protein ABFW12_32560, partial [Mycolicibacterium porcinum]
MKSGQLTRRLTVIAGGAAVIGMISFTAACGTEEKKGPGLFDTSDDDEEIHCGVLVGARSSKKQCHIATRSRHWSRRVSH